MMNKHIEKPKTPRKTASPKSLNKPKTQQRTSGKMARAKALEEARRQQSALADVLSAISGSKFELQPVLDRVVRTAARLCRAKQALIFRYEGGVYRFAAGYSISPAYSEIERRSRISPGPGTLVGRTAMARRAVRINDAWTDPLYERKEDAKIGRHRSMIGVPLLRDGEPIGVIGLSRSRVDPFSERDVELVTTFANQAVIAIENVRLFEAEQQRTHELTESLEQQTAAAEVLQVISRSQGELEPVFATMLEKAVRMCGATFGNIYRWDGEALHIVATHNTPPAFAEERKRSPYRPDPKSPVGRMVASQNTDACSRRHGRGRLSCAARFRSGCGSGARCRAHGLKRSVTRQGRDDRCVFSVPPTRAIFHRQTNQARLQHFATQAVIAIENARLLNELRERTADLTEALGQQKAISGVLQLLSDSSGKLEPIFQAILENAVNICQAHFGNMFLYEDGAFRGVAMFNAPEAYVRARMLAPFTRPPDSGLGRLAATKDIVQIADLLADKTYLKGDPFAVEGVELAGIRTLLAVPMLKDDQLVGCIIIYRQEPRPFSEKQIQLVKNFANQVVLGLENARLLNELRDRTCELERSYTLVQQQASQLDTQARELRKLNEGLEERVGEQVSEIERMSRLRRFLPPQVADLIVTSGMEKQLESHRREITALFCDLRGFTGFTESADRSRRDGSVARLSRRNRRDHYQVQWHARALCRRWCDGGLQ